MQGGLRKSSDSELPLEIGEPIIVGPKSKCISLSRFAWVMGGGVAMAPASLFRTWPDCTLL